MAKITYYIFPSLHDESLEGWVWIPKENALKNKKSKIIKITNIVNNKSLICMARTIEGYFINIYIKKTTNSQTLTDKCNNKTTNSRTLTDKGNIVISGHYRDILEIDENSSCELEINIASFKEKYWDYFRNHPNSIFFLTHTIAVVSISIGILSILLSFVSFIKDKDCCYIYCATVLSGFLMICFLAFLDKVFEDN